MKPINAKLLPVFVLLTAAAGASAWPDAPLRGDEERADPAKAAAVRDFRAVAREIDQIYRKCPHCNGTGKRYGKTCSDCLGDGHALEDKYQDFVDQYVRFCAYVKTHAEVLKQDERFAEKVEKNRKRYLHSIQRHIGPRKARTRVSKGSEAEYQRVREVDGKYNKLALVLVREDPEESVGKGVAFGGKVVRLMTSGEKKLAEVRILTVSTRWRTCFVVPPASVKWSDFDAVEVIGKVVAGDAFRKAFSLEPDAMIIEACLGTE
jgi:hypothetical protein